MKTLLRISLMTLVGGFVLLAAEAMAVVVAPTAVYIDHRTRSATVTLYNPSNQAEEVTIRPAFGYPATDGAGTPRLHLEEESDDPRSAAGWLRVFPERLVLAPGQRQVVRLLGEPPADLPDGEYWSRLIVTSRGQAIPVDSPGRPEIQAGMELEVRTIISANYRKGEVSTGIRVEDLEAHRDGDQLFLRIHLEREGNAAYVGAMGITLEDADGAAVRNWREQIAVYRDYDRQLMFELGDLPSGSFQVRVHLSTERPDIDPQHRLQSTQVEASTPVQVQ